jgi:fructokinase
MVHGLIHPEGGHIRVPILPADKDFEGVCKFHKNCLEGLCTNVSIAKRFGHHVEDNVKIKDDDAVWDQVGYYLGQCCANLILFLSLEKIIIGGGVMNREILYPLIQFHCKEALNGYISHPNLTSVEGLEKVIVKPEIEKDLGIIAAAIVGAGSDDTI